MPTLDVFKSDAFSVTTLTDAINKAPYKPGRIGSLGLFSERGITTKSLWVEEQEGRLELLVSSPRGGVGTSLGANTRKARALSVPHFEKNALILADEVQDVREFGSENTLLGVQTVVNGRLAEIRPMHEVTLEYLRVGAIKGIVLDGDGSTVLHNLFDVFEVSQQTFEINMASDDMRNECVAIQRLSEDELGAETVSGYRAFCGDDFFDALIAHDGVRESLKFQESAVLRTDLRKGFSYGGITWENYRGRVGGTYFFPPEQAYVVPEGTGIFVTRFAPADFMEAANTVGIPVYAKQAADEKFNRHVEIHTQSNPIALCLRPRAVIKVTQST